jgi:hypothetical protein
MFKSITSREPVRDVCNYALSLFLVLCHVAPAAAFLAANVG